jgi:hypothetical protein
LRKSLVNHLKRLGLAAYADQNSRVHRAIWVGCMGQRGPDAPKQGQGEREPENDTVCAVYGTAAAAAEGVATRFH